MAYNKPGTFNPDALPAHAQPEEAAQALSKPRPQQKPLPRPNQYQNQYQNPPPRQASPGVRRASPSGYSQQQPQGHRPSLVQTQNQYGSSYNTKYNNHQDPRLQSPPPPADYGQGQRPRPPRGGYANLPSQQYHHQQSPQPPPQRTLPPPEADSQELYTLFQAANKSRTGSLTSTELGSALVNADFTPFDPSTIKSLMRMFSSTPPNSPQGPVVAFGEFQNLWRFLAAWRQLFERFDEDGSYKINLSEFTNALVAFGYRLSPPFVALLYNSYGRANERRGSRGDQGEMSFDLFVQACIRLKRMTDVFKTYDDDRDGYVTLSFEEFLSEIVKLQE